MDNRRIFSIDDDAGFRSLLKDFLAPTDLESVVTGDAEEFNEAYAELDPGHVAIDMVMPETDGFELVNWPVEQGSKARILVMTGYNPTYAEMAETMGMDRGLKNVMSLTKPVRLTDLRQALHIPQPDEG